MREPEPCYRCHACGQLTPRRSLRAGAWGDVCCPSCGSNALERERTRFDRWYARFFLFKVY